MEERKDWKAKLGKGLEVAGAIVGVIPHPAAKVAGLGMMAGGRALEKKKGGSPYSVIVCYPTRGYILDIVETEEEAEWIAYTVAREDKEWQEIVVIDEATGEIVYRHLRPSLKYYEPEWVGEY